MSSLMKIIIGGLLSALAAWLFAGPFGLASKCGVAPAAEPEAAAPATDATTAVAEAPATAEAVKNCQAEVDAVVKGKTINFESGRAVIKVDSQPLIDAIAAALKDCAGTQIEVAGHTDQQGGDAANMRLSEERANAVVAALADRGVPRERLLPKGFGETKLMDPASTPEALAKNRRIEFSVSAAGASPAADAVAPAN